MRNWTTTLAVSILAFAIAGTSLTAFAEEKDLGKHSKDVIKKACKKNGGELLGVGEWGSYGCAYADAEVLILCNKNGDCTGYVPAQTRAAHHKILNGLKLGAEPAKPAAKPAKAKPAKPAKAKPSPR